MRRTVLRTVVLAALMAGARWCSFGGAWYEPLLYPADKVVLMIFGRGFPPGPNEQGTMWHAWAWGPAALIINTLTFLPLALAFALLCRWSAFLMRLWDSVVLAAGALTLVGGVWSSSLLIVGLLSGEYPPEILEFYYLWFVALPALLCGGVSVVTSYRLMRRDPIGIKLP
jgi:hypothetical protein